MSNVKLFVGDVCRVENKELNDYVVRALEGAGFKPVYKVGLPHLIFNARQVRIDEGVSFNVKLKEHRGQVLPCISKQDAADLMNRGKASAMPQDALIYDVSVYLNDPDVKPDEKARIKEENPTHVLVAVIGESRGALTICRNVVSGVQKMDLLKEECEAALKDSNVFLIED